MAADRLVADLVVERLLAWGVHRVFGYSGDGINGFMGALRRAGGDPEFVQARHEENAALMAVGHAKYTGEVGVMTSTQGPGAVHLLNGLYDAKLDHKPVVAIVGQQPTTALGAEYQQEIDLAALFKDVAAQYVQTVHRARAGADGARPGVPDGARDALAGVRDPPARRADRRAPEELPHEHGVVPTARGGARRGCCRARRTSPRRPRCSTPGSGWRCSSVRARAAPAARSSRWPSASARASRTSLLGKPCVGRDVADDCGVMGHLGTTASGWLLDSCDTLLVVGSNDPWTEFYPAPGQARAVQVDIDGRHLGNRYPVEVGLVGDAAETLAALLPLLEQRDGWRSEVAERVRAWHELAQERAETPAEPLSPERVVRALTPRLPADAQVSVDVGSITYWYARHLTLPPGVPAHLSSTLASMGSGIPYGLAAKLHAPDRPVVALVGDGAMQMNGISELITVAHRWRDWTDPRFVVLVLHNQDLAEVTWEQRETEGDPRFDASQALPTFPYAAYADLLGLTGIRIDRPEDVDAAWDRALEADRPVLIEAVVDPDVPLLPPFPGGREKLDSFRRALDQEDGSEHARALLDEQARQEGE